MVYNCVHYINYVRVKWNVFKNKKLKEIVRTINSKYFFDIYKHN